jgi:uncharacterized SAM-binding protein YcdF (DUF218 family)
MISDRERFLAALLTGPLTKADAIVLLTGDGETRVATAVGLFHAGAAPLIAVTGGVHAPPYCLKADAIAGTIYGKGIATDRVRIDVLAQNTRESAVNVIDTAVDERWLQILLVTSAYHLPRAMLTFIAELRARKLDETIRIVPVPCANQPWFVPVSIAPPIGIGLTRMALLADEFSKIDEYREFGHVASYRDGLKYLEHWEGK